jgi:hypothetical protein
MSPGSTVPVYATHASITDDYGNKARVDIREISAVVHTHINEDLNANQDLQILQAHANVKLQNRAATDPTLKAAMATQEMLARAANGAHFRQ